MPETPWDRRELLKAISAGAATGFLAGAARDAAAQQVKWSEGTEPPKLKAPPNACDCHHHIYDARYPVDPKAVLRREMLWSRITALFRSESAPAAMSS
jgi:hypothetical protein